MSAKPSSAAAVRANYFLGAWAFLNSRNLRGLWFGACHPAWREPRVTRRVGGSRHLQPYGQGSFGQAKPCERPALLPVCGRSALVSSLLAFVSGWSALAAAAGRSAFSSGVAPASPVTTAAPSANATAPANILETDIFTHPPSPGSLPGGCWVISRRGAAKGSRCQRRPYAVENTRLFLTYRRPSWRLQGSRAGRGLGVSAMGWYGRATSPPE